MSYAGIFLVLLFVVFAVVVCVFHLKKNFPCINFEIKVAEYTWFLFDYLYKKCINHKVQHV
jgi:hypothetical protein